MYDWRSDKMVSVEISFAEAEGRLETWQEMHQAKSFPGTFFWRGKCLILAGTHILLMNSASILCILGQATSGLGFSQELICA